MTITQRQRWTKATLYVSLGDVFMQGNKPSPMFWPVGRVSAVHLGTDGTVRVVRLQLGDHSYIRPDNKVVLLPPPQ